MAVRPAWMWLDRALLVLLVVALIPGTPGLGVDTREQGAGAALIGSVFGLGFLLLLVGFGTSWKWRRLATWSALVGVAIIVVLSVLDLASFLGPPPPAAIVALDLIQIAIGVAFVWRRWSARSATFAAASAAK